MLINNNSDILLSNDGVIVEVDTDVLPHGI